MALVTPDEAALGQRDRTARYQALVAQIRRGEPVLGPSAAEVRYLFVPGLFAEHYPMYMDANLARAAALGLAAERVAVDTGATLADNAARVRDAVLAADAEVVLLGHSKGGVEIATALARYPTLWGKVRAVIAMQAPFAGTPLADDLAANEAANTQMQWAIRALLGGDPRMVEEMRRSARAAFEAAWPYPRHVPTVSLVTSTSSPLSGLALVGRWHASRYGGRCDGLVRPEDAVLPGSDVVDLDDMDHAGPVFPVPLGIGAGQTPAEVTEALIALAWERAAASEVAP